MIYRQRDPEPYIVSTTGMLHWNPRGNNLRLGPRGCAAAATARRRDGRRMTADEAAAYLRDGGITCLACERQASMPIRPPCPDGGTCHHRCAPPQCMRVSTCAPLSGVFPDDEWPAEIRHRHAWKATR